VRPKAARINSALACSNVMLGNNGAHRPDDPPERPRIGEIARRQGGAARILHAREARVGAERRDGAEPDLVPSADHYFGASCHGVMHETEREAL